MNISEMLYKYKPDIKFWGGVASCVTATIILCTKAKHIQKSFNDAKEDIKSVDEEHVYVVEKPKPFARKMKIAGKFTVALVKDCALPIVMEGTGIYLIVSSNKELKLRHAELVNALNFTSADLARYKENARAYLENLPESKVETVNTNDGECAPAQEDQKESDHIPSLYRGNYSFIFDESSTLFDNNALLNVKQMKDIERYANDLLRSNGHIFLNDVLEMLGMQKVDCGQFAGWVWKKDESVRVSFGVFDKDTPETRKFINGVEKCVWLDFNCEDNILDTFELHGWA